MLPASLSTMQATVGLALNGYIKTENASLFSHMSISRVFESARILRETFPTKGTGHNCMEGHIKVAQSIQSTIPLLSQLSLISLPIMYRTLDSVNHQINRSKKYGPRFTVDEP